MKFFIPLDTDDKAPTSGIGITSKVPSFGLKLRDAASVEIVPWKGEVGGYGDVFQLSEDVEIVFCLKVPGDKEGDAVVLGSSFTWDSVNLLYAGKPSFKTVQLIQKFIGAATASVKTDSYTLQGADKNSLVIINASASKTFTLPTGIGAVNDVIYLMRGDTGAVNVAAAVGVTLTVATGISQTMQPARVLRLTNTGTNAWTLDAAPEAETLDLVGEITWHSIATPDDWETSGDFDVKITADVYRGFEGAPDNLADATNYYTKGAVDALLAAQTHVIDDVTGLQTALDGKLEPDGDGSALTGLTKAQVGLGNVDNTSDANKPISSATQTALNGKQATLADVITALAAKRLMSITASAKGIITGCREALRQVFAGASVSASTTPITVTDLTIPANTLAAGDIIRIRAYGVTNNGATASNFTVALRWGGVVQTAVVIAKGTTVSTGTPWIVEAEFTVHSATSLRGALRSSHRTSTILQAFADGDLTFDATASQTIGLQINNSVATATALTVHGAVTEIR